MPEEWEDGLLALTSLRHKLHSTDRRDLFNCECSDNLFDIVNQIDQALSESKMPEIKYSIDVIELPDDEVYFYVLSDEERDSYEDYSDWLENSGAFEEFCEGVETINKDIERYLKEIDQKYGTSFEPTGSTRIY